VKTVDKSSLSTVAAILSLVLFLEPSFFSPLHQSGLCSLAIPHPYYTHRDLLYLSPVLTLLAVSLPIFAHSPKAASRDYIERGKAASLGLLSVLAVAFISLGFFVHGSPYYQ